jgi:hypothetical protein
MDGDVVRYCAANFMTRRVPTPIGEPDGRTTPRLERIVRAFRTAGINAKAESQMDAWLKTHAAFEVPPGQRCTLVTERDHVRATRTSSPGPWGSAGIVPARHRHGGAYREDRRHCSG